MIRIVSRVLMIVFILISFIGCSKKPGDVINDFYSAESWEDKKQYILDTELIFPNEVYNELATYDVEEINTAKKISKDSIIYKAKIIQKNDDKETTQLIQFLVVNTPQGEKIDFNAKLKKNKYSILKYANQKTVKKMYYWTNIQTETEFLRNRVGGKSVMVLEGNIVLAFFKNLSNSPDYFTRVYDFLFWNNYKISCLLEITEVTLYENRETSTLFYFAYLKSPRIIMYDIFAEFQDII